MPVVYSHATRRTGYDTVQAMACDGRRSRVSTINSLSVRPSSSLLLRVSRADTEGDTAMVMDVARALGDLMARCRGALATRQLEVAAAVWGTERLLDGSGCASEVGDGIQVVAGRRAMARVLARAYGQPVGNRLSLYSSPFAGSTERQAAVDGRLAAQGVRLRAIYQQPSLPRRVELSPAGVEIRCANLVPMDMVVDDRTAILPVDPDRPGVALMVISDPAWFQLAGALAQDCWARAEGLGDVC